VITVTLLTVAEAAKLLKVNRNKVYELINTGQLKALRLGRLKVTDSELERFIKSQEA
jgi:excisionase family DNA binding protein